MKLKSTLLLLMVIMATVLILIINISTTEIILFERFNSEVNHHIIYQSVTIILAILVLLVLRFSRKETFLQFFRIGNLGASIKPERLVGINPKSNETWRQFGRNIVIIITLVTAIVMYFQTVKKNEIVFYDVLEIFPFALIFAISNSFVEESITRLGVVVSLYGNVSDKTIQITSAIIFGVIHYWGSPGGIIGVIVAGFLGWFLAKSIIETRGIFWAWLTHFLQDVIIFSVILIY